MRIGTIFLLFFMGFLFSSCMVSPKDTTAVPDADSVEQGDQSDDLPVDSDAESLVDFDNIDEPDDVEVNDDAISDEDGGGGVDEDFEKPDDDLFDCSIPPESPTGRLYPIPGEIFYAQIGLAGFSMGESALLVGPGGSVVLIDAGNDSHDKVISAVISDTITHMNSAGFPMRPTDEVDTVLITHMHADHSDGLQDLLQDISLKGKIIHRGFFDITNAANEATVTQLCETIESNPGGEQPLCEGELRTSCTDWSTGLPSTSCSSESLSFADGASLNIVGVNGFMAGDSYEALKGDLLTEDSNGENARSLTAVIEHGDFRFLLAGDLTGGGSDTDPVEQFYASRLSSVTDIGVQGIDVLHAGHHGRNTSSSPEWIDRLIPHDGLSRNVIMGVSTAHINSPHQETLNTLFFNGRLLEGRAWTTTIATGGATNPLLLTAFGGSVLILTSEGGKIYHIQIIGEDGTILQTKSYYSVKGCS